jgi:hypothetical protein
MSLDAYITKLRAIISTALTQDAVNNAALPAFKEFEADYKERIFVRGLNSAGKRIGQYSTTPFYINPKAESLRGVKRGGIKPQGKFGQVRFKNGKRHKTKYLGSGYRQLRQLTGRQSGFVDLNFSGASLQTLQTGVKSGRLIFGFTNAQRQVILEAQETRYNTLIFRPTATEREDLVERSTVAIISRIRKVLNT